MLFEVLGILGAKAALYGWNTLDGIYKADKWGVYEDGNGIKRFKKNFHMAMYQDDYEGYYVLKDLDTGNIVVNITKETEKWAREYAIKNNRSVYISMPCRDGLAKSINNKLNGVRYKDVKTNTPYVGRRYGWYGNELNFYMNMNTYKFERLMDIEFVNRTPEEINKIKKIGESLIKKRNEEVDKIMKTNPKVGLYDLYLNHREFDESFMFDDEKKFRRKEFEK